MYRERITRLIQALKANRLDAVALNPGPSLFYLTGLTFHLMERPIVCLFTTDKTPLMILPELERPKAETSQLEIELITYGEDEASRIRAFEDAAVRLGLNGRCVGIEPLRLRVLELRLMESVAPQVTFTSGERALSSLRIVKDETEISAIRRAVVIAEDALKATLPLIRLGMTERELASELTMQLLRAGSQPEIPFSPIVASGPNSALPHATPTERALKPGDLLILDWGATADGYISDITRTFAVGEIDAELVKIHSIVQQSNASGRDAIRPDITAQDIDRASRAVIESAGYGQYFIHRTGHGIGLEAHEPPYIREGNPQSLTPGMTFTVEPGIYLPGRGGVRVEDDLLVTGTGGESISTYNREIEVIG